MTSTYTLFKPTLSIKPAIYTHIQPNGRPGRRTGTLKPIKPIYLTVFYTKHPTNNLGFIPIYYMSLCLFAQLSESLVAACIQAKGDEGVLQMALFDLIGML
jgi:hypothetical protein